MPVRMETVFLSFRYSGSAYVLSHREFEYRKNETGKQRLLSPHGRVLSFLDNILNSHINIGCFTGFALLLSRACQVERIRIIDGLMLYRRLSSGAAS